MPQTIERLAKLAKRYNLNLRLWLSGGNVLERRSTVLGRGEEAMILAFRKHTLFRTWAGIASTNVCNTTGSVICQ